MTRTTAREIAIQMSFAAAAGRLEPEALMEDFFSEEHYGSLGAEHEIFSERPDKKQMDYIRRLTLLTAENCSEIDGFIERYSKGWKPERISKTALSVLRCAICEILYMDDIPNSAAINEAVELDKGYDEPDTVAFVNGVLGGFMRGEFSCGPGEKAEPAAPAEEEAAPGAKAEKGTVPSAEDTGTEEAADK